MNRLGAILLLPFVLARCESPVTWQHPEGCDTDRLKRDIRECRVLARDMTNEQGKGLKVPGSPPHGGVAEALLLLGMHEEFFESCMSSRGWKKKTPK